jgi:hypothetical protein
LGTLNYQFKTNVMYKKLKISLILIALIITASTFLSCTSDNDEFTGSRSGNAVDTNAAKQAFPNTHTLSIINNSTYTYVIYNIGAQTNRDLYDPIEISHRANLLKVAPHTQVIYYDYKYVSNSEFAVDKWKVTDHSMRDGFIGNFSCDAMCAQYGMLSNPNDPNSARFPVWNYMVGGVIDQSGEFLRVLGGNLSGASLAVIGNTDQGFNSVLKFGTTTAIAEEAQAGIPGHSTPKAMVKWRQANTGIRNGGAAQLTIENIPVR